MAEELSMKLIIDTKGDKVLFAEAGKEVVDFLFSLLVLPMGSIIKLLTKDINMAGCIANICTSIESLEETYYIKPNDQGKKALLTPQASSTTAVSRQSLPLPLPNWCQSVGLRSYFTCTGAFTQHIYCTDVKGTLCPICNQQMTVSVTYVAPKSGNIKVNGGRGYVKGVTYTIMDDLTVAPMSTISAIAILNKFDVKDFVALKEKTVKFDVDKGLDLLKASFQSKTVLSDVFLTAKRKRNASPLT